MKIFKRQKYKKLYWLLTGLGLAGVVFVFFILLLLYRPTRYRPASTEMGAEDSGVVSPYLTHQLLPQLYNGAQRQEPFELVIDQNGINEVIASSKWPKDSELTRVWSPQVRFTDGKIIVMGTSNIAGAKIVVSVQLKPVIDEDRLLNLNVTKVKIGAVNMTTAAKVIGQRMFQNRINSGKIDKDAIGAKIAASLLNYQPFEPIFKVEDKKVRLQKVKIQKAILTLNLIPALD